MKKNRSLKTKRLVSVAMFSALAYVVTYLCSSMFPKVGGFLTLDIKDSLIVLCTLIFGPIAGLFIAFIVPLIEMLTISTTAWYGLIMNVLSSVTFCLVTGTIYKYKRSFYGAIIALVSGIFSVTAVMMLANLFITPLYFTHFMGVPMSMNDVIDQVPTLLLPFNFTKATLNAAIVLLLYKPLSTVLKRLRMVEYSLSNKHENKFNIRSLIVTIASAAVIAAALCIVFFVINK